MLAYFVAPPPGFFAANELINALPEHVLTQMSLDALKMTHHHVGKTTEDRYSQLFDDEQSSQFNQAQIRSAMNAIAFVLRGATIQKLNEESLAKVLQQHTDLDERARSTITSVWAQNSDDQGTLVLRFDRTESKSDGDCDNAADDDRRQALQLGHLTGIEWKVGIAMSSSACENLNAAFVSLKLQISESDGSTSTHPLELDMEEFQHFAEQFRQIARQIANV